MRCIRRIGASSEERDPFECWASPKPRQVFCSFQMSTERTDVPKQVAFAGPITAVKWVDIVQSIQADEPQIEGSLSSQQKSSGRYCIYGKGSRLGVVDTTHDRILVEEQVLHGSRIHSIHVLRAEDERRVYEQLGSPGNGRVVLVCGRRSMAIVIVTTDSLHRIWHRYALSDHILHSQCISPAEAELLSGVDCRKQEEKSPSIYVLVGYGNNFVEVLRCFLHTSSNADTVEVVFRSRCKSISRLLYSMSVVDILPASQIDGDSGSSSGSSLVVCGTALCELCVWSVNSGQLYHRWTAHDGAVTAVQSYVTTAESENCSVRSVIVVSTGEDRTMRVWKLHIEMGDCGVSSVSSIPIACIYGHNARVWNGHVVHVDPKAETCFVLSSSEDATSALWKVDLRVESMDNVHSNGTLVYRDQGHFGQNIWSSDVMTVCTPGTQSSECLGLAARVVTGGADNGIRVWEKALKVVEETSVGGKKTSSTANASPEGNVFKFTMSDITNESDTARCISLMSNDVTADRSSSNVSTSDWLVLCGHSHPMVSAVDQHANVHWRMSLIHSSPLQCIRTSSSVSVGVDPLGFSGNRPEWTSMGDGEGNVYLFATLRSLRTHVRAIFGSGHTMDNSGVCDAPGVHEDSRLLWSWKAHPMKALYTSVLPVYTAMELTVSAGRSGDSTNPPTPSRVLSFFLSLGPRHDLSLWALTIPSSIPKDVLADIVCSGRVSVSPESNSWLMNNVSVVYVSHLTNVDTVTSLPAVAIVPETNVMVVGDASGNVAFFNLATMLCKASTGDINDPQSPLNAGNDSESATVLEGNFRVIQYGTAMMGSVLEVIGDNQRYHVYCSHIPVDDDHPRCMRSTAPDFRLQNVHGNGQQVRTIFPKSADEIWTTGFDANVCKLERVKRLDDCENGQVGIVYTVAETHRVPNTRFVDALHITSEDHVIVFTFRGTEVACQDLSTNVPLLRVSQARVSVRQPYDIRIDPLAADSSDSSPIQYVRVARSREIIWTRADRNTGSALVGGGKMDTEESEGRQKRRRGEAEAPSASVDRGAVGFRNRVLPRKMNQSVVVRLLDDALQVVTVGESRYIHAYRISEAVPLKSLWTIDAEIDHCKDLSIQPICGDTSTDSSLLMAIVGAKEGISLWLLNPHSYAGDPVLRSQFLVTLQWCDLREAKSLRGGHFSDKRHQRRNIMTRHMSGTLSLRSENCTDLSMGGSDGHLRMMNVTLKASTAVQGVLSARPSNSGFETCMTYIGELPIPPCSNYVSNFDWKVVATACDEMRAVNMAEYTEVNEYVCMTGATCANCSASDVPCSSCTLVLRNALNDGESVVHRCTEEFMYGLRRVSCQTRVDYHEHTDTAMDVEMFDDEEDSASTYRTSGPIISMESVTINASVYLIFGAKDGCVRIMNATENVKEQNLRRFWCIGPVHQSGVKSISVHPLISEENTFAIATVGDDQSLSVLQVRVDELGLSLHTHTAVPNAHTAGAVGVHWMSTRHCEDTEERKIASVGVDQRLRVWRWRKESGEMYRDSRDLVVDTSLCSDLRVCGERGVIVGDGVEVVEF